METKISQGNADVLSMAYVANAGFRGHAKTTLKFEGVSGTIWEPGNTVNGYRTEITNQINAGDVFMGNFADLVVLMWGGPGAERRPLQQLQERFDCASSRSRTSIW